MNDRLLLFVLPATNQLKAGQSNPHVLYMTNGILIRMLVIHSKGNVEESFSKQVRLVQ